MIIITDAFTTIILKNRDLFLVAFHKGNVPLSSQHVSSMDFIQNGSDIGQLTDQTIRMLVVFGSS